MMHVHHARGAGFAAKFGADDRSSAHGRGRKMPRNDEPMTDADELQMVLEGMVDRYLIKHQDVLPDYSDFEDDPEARYEYLDLTITVLEIVIGPRPGKIFRVTFDDDKKLVLTRP